MTPPITILIPTYNNFEYLHPCLSSILYGSPKGLFRVIVVNNGHQDSCSWISKESGVEVLNTGENYGWEGGLKEGLKHTDSPFIIFMNDDTFVPPNQRYWMQNLIQHFRHDSVGAVGPSSNVVMGRQNIFHRSDETRFVSSYLIGFCLMVRREALEKAGGIDDSLPGGDDIDLSIRLQDAGYKLLVDKEVFIYHHGFKTGTRVHGDHTQAGGWNSIQFTEATNLALIKKHGFKKWFECLYDIRAKQESTPIVKDIEGDMIRELIIGDKVLDLGCGGNKTVPHAVGVDMIPKGEVIDTLSNTISQADIVADITQALPFEPESYDTIIARHILEHVIDPIEVLTQWKKVLKSGGQLVIAVPDETIIRSIPMNIEHVHAYTPLSLTNIVKSVGLTVKEVKGTGNNISFILVAEKL